jgi:hypothetical protein
MPIPERYALPVLQLFMIHAENPLPRSEAVF